MTRLATCVALALLVALTHTTCLTSDTCAAPESMDKVFTHHVKSLRCKEPGADFEFSPLGVSFGTGGDLYIVDSDYSRIFVAPDTLGGMTLFADCPDDLDDCQFIDCEVGPAGGLFVSEKTSGRIVVFDRWGGFAGDRAVGEGTAIGLNRTFQ